MRVVAVTMVRDERDVIGWTIRHLLAEGVDRILVADNMSIDGTWEYLLDLMHRQPRLNVQRDEEVGYFQSRKMSALAAQIADPGDWVIPFDADEIWYSPHGRLADVLEASSADVVRTHPYTHIPQATDDHTDPNPFTRIRCRSATPETEPQHKVAFRWRPGCVIHMGQHGVDGAGPVADDDLIGVRHFQYRCYDQVLRKVYNGVQAYDAAGLPKLYGTHWRDLASMPAGERAAWWDEHRRQDVILDPAPYRCA
jgi:glycosyltransferase involved in cell wall biosynthesis